MAKREVAEAAARYIHRDVVAFLSSSLAELPSLPPGHASTGIEAFPHELLGRILRQAMENEAPAECSPVYRVVGGALTVEMEEPDSMNSIWLPTGVACSRLFRCASKLALIELARKSAAGLVAQLPRAPVSTNPFDEGMRPCEVPYNPICSLKFPNHKSVNRPLIVPPLRVEGIAPIIIHMAHR